MAYGDYDLLIIGPNGRSPKKTHWQVGSYLFEVNKLHITVYREIDIPEDGTADKQLGNKSYAWQASLNSGSIMIGDATITISTRQLCDPKTGAPYGCTKFFHCSHYSKRRHHHVGGIMCAGNYDPGMRRVQELVAEGKLKGDWKDYHITSTWFGGGRTRIYVASDSGKERGFTVQDYDKHWGWHGVTKHMLKTFLAWRELPDEWVVQIDPLNIFGVNQLGGPGYPIGKSPEPITHKLVRAMKPRKKGE